MANAAPEERDSVYKRFLVYSILVVIAGPALAWLLLIVPGWLKTRAGHRCGQWRHWRRRRGTGRHPAVLRSGAVARVTTAAAV